MSQCLCFSSIFQLFCSYQFPTSLLSQQLNSFKLFSKSNTDLPRTVSFVPFPKYASAPVSHWTSPQPKSGKVFIINMLRDHLKIQRMKGFNLTDQVHQNIQRVIDYCHDYWKIHIWTKSHFLDIFPANHLLINQLFNVRGSRHLTHLHIFAFFCTKSRLR